MKDPKKKKRAFIICISFLWFFSNSFILDEAMRLWEVQTKRIDELQTYDAAIVLGTFTTYDKDFDRIQFRESTDRLMQAIELYKKGVVKKIIYSGGSGSILHPEEKEGVYIKRYLVNIGIPDSAIIEESASMNTRQNAVNVKSVIVSNFPDGSFLLITSASHMRRAQACFEKEGIAITSFSTNRFSGPRKYEFDHMLIPNSETLFSWEMLNHELIGWVAYKIVGYI